MLPSIQIPVGISTQDCLSWSSHGELAIAAGEEVYLLLPRHEGPESWAHVHFRVNTFTYDEWPLRSQASFANMSIGEEQGKVTVALLQWSPPGLAKYRRSILAILTTNLMLSLWAPGPDPSDPDGWVRIWIINDMAIPQSISLNSTIRSLERIRSMAWAPSNCQRADEGSPFSTRRWGVPLLAVTDDKDGFCILTIHSPSTFRSAPWDVQVIAYRTFTPVHRRTCKPSLLSEAFAAKHFIESISFADWDSAGELPVALSAFGTIYQLKLKIVLEPSIAAMVVDDQVTQASDGLYQGSPRQVPIYMEAPMDRHKASYGKESHLGLHRIILKTWGIAHLGDVSAVCVTSHPARMVEYQAPVAESATIIFGVTRGGDDIQGPTLFPSQNAPENDPNEALQTILSTIFSTLRTSRSNGRSIKLTRFDLKIIYIAIIAQIVLNMNKSQPQSDANDLENALLIVEESSGAALQNERLLIASSQRSPENVKSPLTEWAKERSQNGFDPMAPGVQLLDNCPFCGDGYLGLAGGIEGFTDAYCPNKHPFGRNLCVFLCDLPANNQV